MIRLIINLIVDPAGITTGIDFSYPLYVFIGNAITGVGFNLANIILFSKLGALIMTLVTVTGQMIMVLTIDQFEMFNLQKRKIDSRRIATLVLMIIGIAFVKFL